MKNKLISLCICLIFICTSIVSLEAIAPTPKVELNDYQLTIDKIDNINISGTVSIGVGQFVGIYDASGNNLYAYTSVKDSNNKESFKIQLPSMYLKEGKNTFKVKSLPIRGKINGSNPKTINITVKLSSSKEDQVITVSNLTLKVNEKKNLNAKVNSGLPLTYKVDNSNVATVDASGNVVGRKAGTTKVTISQSGNEKYNPTSKTITITVKDLTPIKEYTIKYNANYGTGTMSAQKVKGNVSTKLKANTFKRPYYTFAGWAESKNGKVVYKNKAAIKTNRNLTLYAKWTASYKKPNGKVAEGQSPKAGIAFSKMKYKKGSHSRGIVCVIRTKDPGLANAIADNAEKITRNNKVGYSKSSGVGPKLYTQLVKKGPSKAKGKASCSPFAICCLKYSMYKNPEYSFATTSKYGINCNWRSDSKTNIRTGMKSVKSKIEKSKKSCPYVMIYDTSKFKNWKTKLYRGDIAICKHHVFVVL